MAEPFSYSFFDTAIGSCVIVLGARGVAGVGLPERSLEQARTRITERFPEAHEAQPNKIAASAIEGIVALLSGRNVSLSSIPLDMRGLPPFHAKVYQYARTIPPGDTQSYGEVASALGSPFAARAVGQALSRNPFAIVVPCHRVLAAKGKIGGFTAEGGLDTKKRMLMIEQGVSHHPLFL